MLNKNHDRVFQGWRSRKICWITKQSKPQQPGKRAQEKVIAHYGPMIDELAVDEDMKQHLIMKLLEACRISQWSRHKGKKTAPDAEAIQPPRPASFVACANA